MIKSLLIVLFTFFLFQLSAQTEKGTILLGGQFSYSKTFGKDASDYNIGRASIRKTNLIPQLGYFIKENIAIGTGIGYTYYKQSYVKQKGLVIAPFGRYYARLWTGNLKFVGQLAFPLQFLKSDPYYYYADNEVQVYGVTASPGFVFFPAKKLGIELLFNAVSYNRTSEKEEEISIGDNLFTPMIGVQFHL